MDEEMKAAKTQNKMSEEHKELQLPKEVTDVLEKKINNMFGELVDEELIEVFEGLLKERFVEMVDIRCEEVKEELEKAMDVKIEVVKKEIEVKIEDLKKVMLDLKEAVEVKIEELEKVIKDKDQILEEERCEMEEIEDLNSALIIKERQSNGELQEARKELIRGMRALSGDGSSTTIGVKKMGLVDDKALMKACKQKFSDVNVDMCYDILLSKLQKTITDPAWYPFKRVGTGEKMKEVVDEEDEQLKNVRRKWGKDVMKAVKTALEELNEFNPSGRYPVPVLWNFEQERKATLKEGIAHLTQQLKLLKRN